MRCLLPLLFVGCTAVVDLEHLEGEQTVGAGGSTSSASNTGSGAAGTGGQGAGGTPSGYAQVVLADQPLGYWRLDEASGSTAFSSVDGGPAGTYTDACSFGEPGVANSAVKFDGSGCRIDFGNVFAFEGHAEFSLEAWVKPALDDSPLGRICSKEELDETAHRQGYDLLLDGAAVSFDRWLDDAVDSVNAASPLTAGNFTHVVATYDGARMRVYIDGGLSSFSNTTKAIVNVSAPFLVGASSISNSSFEGVLDEVAVYGHALTEEQVQAHYSAALSGL
ncbi:MAG TPA: LamG domain-containing protein [Polyangiaceae bacterium]|jgi:hypothetical protein|nr:LamG domain-containing protein [Polyangiaceae bacterium]